MARFAKGYLGLAGLVFGATGLTFVLAPGLVAALREHGGSPDAINDVRAVYGGVELGLGLFLGACASRERLHEAGLLAAGIVGAVAGVCRVAGFALLPGTPLAHLGYAALDLAFAAAALHGLRISRASSS